MNNYRTHNCNELNLKNVGETVKLAGWVQTIRNLGGMKFIDLRDEQGITQIVVSAEMELKDIERSIITTYRKKIWVPFIKGINDYKLINENDKIYKEQVQLGGCSKLLP